MRWVGNWGTEWGIVYDADEGVYWVVPFIEGYEAFKVRRLDEIGEEIAKRKEQKNGKEADRDAD